MIGPKKGAVELALELGHAAADCYRDEFEAGPARETVGDWDASAWAIAVKDLRDAGMTDEDYDRCLSAWRAGFFASDD